MLCFTLTVRGSFIKEKEADIAMDDEKCFFFYFDRKFDSIKEATGKSTSR